jgi:hypothetical protein
MGAAYARVALDIAEPRVGLLSIGEEAGKGTDLIREAHDLLAAQPITFIGNLDARQLFSGDVEVIVCDGFTGNIALKVGESLAELIERMLGDELGLPAIASAGLGDGFERFRRGSTTRARRGRCSDWPASRWSATVIVGGAVESGIIMAARAGGRIVERLAGRWQCPLGGFVARGNIRALHSFSRAAAEARCSKSRLRDATPRQRPGRDLFGKL